ncbi:4585_t:CDS:2, partial [Funneliformis geosporum]
NLDTEIDIENDLGGVFMDSISYIAEHYKQFLFIVTFLRGQIKCSFTRTSMLLELALNGCTTIPTSENELRTAILKTNNIIRLMDNCWMLITFEEIGDNSHKCNRLIGLSYLASFSESAINFRDRLKFQNPDERPTVANAIEDICLNILLYGLPGEFSKYDKRHDNDLSDISNISIIPTKEEALLLDTQFHLLREDMMTPFVKKIRNDMQSFMYIYYDVEFVGITCRRRNGIENTLRFTPPPVRGSYYDSKTYWEIIQAY